MSKFFVLDEHVYGAEAWAVFIGNTSNALRYIPKRQSLVCMFAGCYMKDSRKGKKDLNMFVCGFESDVSIKNC